MIRCKSSKLALLHRVKERKTPSLSAQAGFAPFSLKVAWSGKSPISSIAADNLLMVQVCLREYGANGFAVF